MNSRTKKLIVAGAAVLALGVGGTAVAGSVGGDDNGAALDRASRIAIERVGGGRVTGSELQDEEGYYEIEVTRDDGSQVDVHLDSHFSVLNAKGDGANGDN
jgi:hypothetical protein